MNNRWIKISTPLKYNYSNATVNDVGQTACKTVKMIQPLKYFFSHLHNSHLCMKNQNVKLLRQNKYAQ